MTTPLPNNAVVEIMEDDPDSFKNHFVKNNLICNMK